MDLIEFNLKCHCRLCGEKTSFLINVLEDSNLQNDIFLFTTIRIQTDDDLPTCVCFDCNSSITSIIEFRRKCISTQDILRELSTAEAALDTDKCIKDDENVTNVEETTIEFCSVQFDNENDECTEISEDSSEINETALIEDTELKQQSNIEVVNQGLMNITTEDTTHESIPKIIDGKLKYKSSLRPCDICGKMIEKHRLRGHINRHNNVKPYVCNSKGCQKSFYCHYKLNNHIRSCCLKVQFECDICGKAYDVQKSLYNHKQKHKTPNYSCNICDRKYKNNTYLKQHMRTHTGERPYSCQHCKMAFASSYNLKTHLRSHTKEKPFSCTFCSASYGYNSLLKSHMERCHGVVR